MNKFEPNTNNFNTKKEVEIKNPIMLKSQSRMVSSLHQQNAQTRGNKLEARKPEKKIKPGKAGSAGPGGSAKPGAGPMAATRNGQPTRQGYFILLRLFYIRLMNLQLKSLLVWLEV